MNDFEAADTWHLFFPFLSARHLLRVCQPYSWEVGSVATPPFVRPRQNGVLNTKVAAAAVPVYKRQPIFGTTAEELMFSHGPKLSLYLLRKH